MTTKTPKAEQADKEWTDLQRDLDTLGEQLNSLRDHSAALGETVMSNLEARFQDVRTRALGYRSATEEQLETMRKQALEQASQTQSTISETTAKSAEMAKETALQAWEKAEPLRQGAQEVGKGFLRAWGELAASFGKAAEKVQAEKEKSSAAEETHKPG